MFAAVTKRREFHLSLGEEAEKEADPKRREERATSPLGACRAAVCRPSSVRRDSASALSRGAAGRGCAESLVVRGSAAFPPR